MEKDEKNGSNEGDWGVHWLGNREGKMEILADFFQDAKNGISRLVFWLIRGGCYVGSGNND